MRLSRYLCLILILLGGGVFAQSAPGSSHLLVPIDFEVINGDFTNAVVYMRRDGETVATFKGAHAMRVRLDYNTEYRLDFTKPGYITKSIRINTGTPEDRRKIGFDPYKIGVRLFKQYEGVNIVVYNQPVAFIRFLPEMDEFGYDTDYTKSILSELKTTEDILEKRAAEERKQEKLSAAKKKEDRKVNSTVEASPEKTNAALSPQLSIQSGEPAESSAYPAADPHPAAILPGNGDGEKQMSAGGFGAGGEDPKTSGASSAGEQPLAASAGTNGEDVPKSGLNASAAADPQPVKVSTPALEERRMEVVREKNRTVTWYFVKSAGQEHAFKMVQYDWGGLFYFINGNQNVSQHVFNVLTQPASR